MHEQFIDRILHCADCDTDFIFTAGEQLFFFDKQFKNDPKRCKPCKSRRSGLAAAAAGLSNAVRIVSRPETRTHCSACGVETTVPFKPTQGRPVLCRRCFGSKAPVTRMPDQRDAAQTDRTQAAAAQLSDLSVSPSGEMLSPDAVLLAVTSMTSSSAHSSVATQADVTSAARMTKRDIDADATFSAYEASVHPLAGYVRAALSEQTPGQQRNTPETAAQA